MKLPKKINKKSNSSNPPSSSSSTSSSSSSKVSSTSVTLYDFFKVKSSIPKDQPHHQHHHHSNTINNTNNNRNTNLMLGKPSSISTRKSSSSSSNSLLKLSNPLSDPNPIIFDSELFTSSDECPSSQLSELDVKWVSGIQEKKDHTKPNSSTEKHIEMSELSSPSKEFSLDLFIHNPPPRVPPLSSLTLSSSDSSLTRHKRSLSFDLSSDLDSHDESFDSKSIECPFCGKTISVEWHDLISELYTIILQYTPPIIKNNHRRKVQSIEMKIQFIIENRFNPALHDQFKERLPIHQKFCLKHVGRSFMESAKIEGWPTREKIQFNNLSHRLHHLKPFLDDLIFNQPSPISLIRDEILNEFQVLGANRFRSRRHLMTSLPKLRVGYYGPKGQACITETLHQMYLHTDKEDASFPTSLFEPLKKLEYIQLILVPSTGWLLIHEDLSRKTKTNVSYKEAYELMKRTSDYGDYLFPIN